MKINKKYFIFACITIIIILIIIFAKNNYKKFGSGNNNIGNSNQEISEYILNINSYSAKLEVTINSNKNENKYILAQEFNQPNIAKQVVQEPGNIEGLTIINDGKNLTINNTKLDVTKIYENYNYITENHLFLNTFIKKTDAIKFNIPSNNERYFTNGRGLYSPFAPLKASQVCIIYLE